MATGSGLTIEQWARTSLVDDADDIGRLSDSKLAPYVDSVLRAVLANPQQPENACVGDDRNVIEATLTGNDLKNFREWIGRMVAAEYGGTPGGRKLIADSHGETIVEERADDKTLKYANGLQVVTVADFLAEQVQRANAARVRIACIAAAIKAKPVPRVGMGLELAGHRRAIDARRRSGRCW